MLQWVTLSTNKKPPIAVDGMNKLITHIIPHEEETKMKYRVRLNEVLYFARFEEHVADVTCGTVVEVEE